MMHWNRWASVLAVGVAMGTMACADGKTAEHFSNLERCLVGAPPKDDAELAQRWRALELSLRKTPSQTTAKDWPKRCEVYANSLYQSVDASSGSSMLRKELAGQLGCTDKPGSCKFPDEGAVLTGPANLWRAAKIMGLEQKEPTGVEAPVITGKPLLLGANWPALADKAWVLADSHIAANGKVWLLLRAAAGRVQVRLCELVGGQDPKTSFAEAKCRSPHADVPSLPLQSVMLVDHDAIPVLAGLTPDGRKAYDFDTGKELQVRGYPGSEVIEGVAVERGENDEGFEAYVLAKGKQGKALKLDAVAPLAGPKTVGEFVVWVERDDKGAEALVVEQSTAPTKLKTTARLAGGWGKDDLRACRTAGGWAVASWGLAKGNRGARATVGNDGTEVMAAFYDQAKNTWTGPVSGKIPFDRDVESPASCADGSLTLAWAKKGDNQPTAGRLNCTPTGCSSSQSSWTALDVQAWAGVAPLSSNRLLVIYRTTLGDIRARIGGAAAMGEGIENVLADDQDHGGPVIGEPSVLVSEGAAVLLFKGESGLSGMRIGADGAAKPLPVK